MRTHAQLKSQEVNMNNTNVFYTHFTDKPSLKNKKKNPTDFGFTAEVSKHRSACAVFYQMCRDKAAYCPGSNLPDQPDYNTDCCSQMMFF